MKLQNIKLFFVGCFFFSLYEVIFIEYFHSKKKKYYSFHFIVITTTTKILHTWKCIIGLP